MKYDIYGLGGVERMELKSISALLEEIEFLRKSNSMLEEVINYIDPYDHQINGKDCGNLPRKIHEHLYSFDDAE